MWTKPEHNSKIAITSSNSKIAKLVVINVSILNFFTSFPSDKPFFFTSLKAVLSASQFSKKQTLFFAFLSHSLYIPDSFWKKKKRKKRKKKEPYSKGTKDRPKNFLTNFLLSPTYDQVTAANAITHHSHHKISNACHNKQAHLPMLRALGRIYTGEMLLISCVSNFSLSLSKYCFNVCWVLLVHLSFLLLFNFVNYYLGLCDYHLKTWF